VGNCALFLVFAPDRLGGIDHLLREALGVEAWVRNVPRIEGVEGITLPGDPERRFLAERRSRGIPIDAGNWTALVKLADELGVAVPNNR
jgi:LDH2 family malate/lactate/ureidoglycolate dehydrogenase